MKKEYSKEQLEKKVRIYNFLKKISVPSFLVVCVIAAASTFYNPTPPKPQILKDYQNAQKTKNILENKRQELFEIVNLPYKTKETESAFNIIYKYHEEQVAALNKAIVGVKNSISKIEETPKLKQYFEKKQMAVERHSRRNITNILLTALLGLGINSSYNKLRKYRTKLEYLSEAEASS